MMYAYMIYNTKNNTYETGGGSSTPSKIRVYFDLEQAKKIRNRYFKGHEIHEFKFTERII